MRTRPLICLAALAAACVLPCGCKKHAEADLINRIMGARAEQSSVQAELVRCSAEIDERESRLKNMAAEKTDLKQQTAASEAAVATLQERIAELQRREGEFGRVFASMQQEHDNDVRRLQGRPWRTVTAWNRVRAGMTRDEVSARLGAPRKIVRDRTTEQEQWLYPDPEGGRVAFEKAGEVLRVSDVVPPPWDEWFEAAVAGE